MATRGKGPGELGSAQDVFPITPADGADIAVETRWISVAVGGALVVDKLDGTSVTLTLPAGIFPIRAQRVRATGTTATGLVGYV